MCNGTVEILCGYGIEFLIRIASCDILMIDVHIGTLA